MLLNMSANKRCHHHLAGRPAVGFMMAIFQKHIFAVGNSNATAAENDATYRTLKSLLFILSRLMSAMCRDLMEQMVMPIMQQAEEQLVLCVGNEYRQGILKYLSSFNENFGRQNWSKLANSSVDWWKGGEQRQGSVRSCSSSSSRKDVKATLV